MERKIVKQTLLEYEQGNSNKVWVIQLVECVENANTSHLLHIWYGRRGTKLQMSEVGSKKASRAEYDKRIDDKLREGYTQATDTGEADFGKFPRMDDAAPAASPKPNPPQVIAHSIKGLTSADWDEAKAYFEAKQVPYDPPEQAILDALVPRSLIQWLPILHLAQIGKAELYGADAETKITVRKAIGLLMLDVRFQTELDNLELSPLDLKKLDKDMGVSAWFV